VRDRTGVLCIFLLLFTGYAVVGAVGAREMKKAAHATRNAQRTQGNQKK
jgi:hypothetical protein